VVLRTPEERDLPAIEAGSRDSDVLRWIGPPEGTAEEILALNQARWLAGSPTFAICDPDDACLGHVWVNRGTKDPAVGYVGYWLLPAARGRGLATRAVRLVVAWAVEALGLAEVRLVTEPGNRRSQAVAERSGFVRTGLRTAPSQIDGQIIDHLVYTLPIPSKGPPPTGPRRAGG
jgi:RimJ/RimL family protein N-acetyltransferase